MRDPNELIFSRGTLESAMATNCGYYHGASVQERFAVETEAVVGALEDRLRSAKYVLDFGMGVGRLSKAILEQYPEVHVIGIDNSDSMIAHARKNIPEKYFKEGRIVIDAPAALSKIETGSVDLILAVYVLQHVSAHLLDGALDELKRVVSPDGALYVLNHSRRAVLRDNRVSVYKLLRKGTGVLERLAGYKQIQRLLQKLDNRCIFYDDKVDVQKKLEGRFASCAGVSLGAHPILQSILKKHMSQLYVPKPVGKRNELPLPVVVSASDS